MAHGGQQWVRPALLALPLAECQPEGSLRSSEAVADVGWGAPAELWASGTVSRALLLALLVGCLRALGAPLPCGASPGVP